MFAITSSALNSPGSEPDGYKITTPPATKNAKLSTLDQLCGLSPCCIIQRLLERIFSSNIFSERRWQLTRPRILQMEKRVLLCFWAGRASPTIVTNAREALFPAKSPYLTLSRVSTKQVVSQLRGGAEIFLPCPSSSSAICTPVCGPPKSSRWCS